PELSQLPTNSWLTELETWTKALEQSLRWVLEICNPQNRFSSDPWRQIDEEALSILSWAQSYVKLCSDHVTASRGHYKASCREAKREIRFELRTAPDLTMLTSQLASWPVHTNAFLGNMPEFELRSLFSRWFKNVSLGVLGRP